MHSLKVLILTVTCIATFSISVRADTIVSNEPITGTFSKTITRNEFVIETFEIGTIEFSITSSGKDAMSARILDMDDRPIVSKTTKRLAVGLPSESSAAETIAIRTVSKVAANRYKLVVDQTSAGVDSYVLTLAQPRLHRNSSVPDPIQKSSSSIDASSNSSESLRVPSSDFLVRISVDRDSHTYDIGEPIETTVVSTKMGYLYLFYLDTAGTPTLLFPNSRDTDNTVAANRPRILPTKSHPSFRLVAKPPYGTAQLTAIVLPEPLSTRQAALIGNASQFAQAIVRSKPLSTRQEFDTLSRNGVAAYYRIEKQILSTYVGSHNNLTIGAARDIAEHNVRLFFAPRAAKPLPPKRYSISIGVSELNDPDEMPEISDAFAQDARDVHEAWAKQKHDVNLLLTGKGATKNMIIDRIRDISQKTRPGDQVIIYWSGHCLRRPGILGKEPDPMTKYLLTFDTDFADDGTIARTALSDKELRRLVQDFDGVTMALIIDSCFSGAVAGDLQPMARAGFESDFAQLLRIGQRNLAFYASSGPGEKSFVLKNKQASVFTSFLVDELNKTINNKESLPSIAHLHQIIAPRVQRYIEKEFPTKQQTPLLMESKKSPFPLIP
jgi:hypothetical protein